MIGLRPYQRAGVDSLLTDAASLIKKHGLAKGVRVNADTGALDIIAALAICCGAKRTDLVNSVTVVDFPIAAAHETKFFMALEVLDGRKSDFEQWADDPEITGPQVVLFLTQAAEHLQRSVV